MKSKDFMIGLLGKIAATAGVAAMFVGPFSKTIGTALLAIGAVFTALFFVAVIYDVL